jgi:hypothetical protein
VHRTAIAKTDLSAAVTGNSVKMEKGKFNFDAANHIEGAAFTGAGINTSAQNTGSNSSIQQTYTIQSNVNTNP